jgi:hypothetical protein
LLPFVRASPRDLAAHDPTLLVRREAQMDRATLYSAAGRVLGYQTVKTLTHLTVHDGSVVSSVSQFRVTCP